jgi:uncharacterized membrane protein HdeD (DUF308 family)
MNETLYEAEVKAVTWGWWLLILTGVLSVVAGIIILVQPGGSLAALAVIAGIYLLLDGIFEIVSAFFRGTRNRGLVALLGVLTTIVGVLLIRHPVSGVVFVAILIGLWLITVGVIRLITAFEELEHRFWHGLAGVLEIVGGIVIVAVPGIGYVTLAILVGISFILNGIGLATLGWGLREVREEAIAAGPPPSAPPAAGIP